MKVKYIGEDGPYVSTGKTYDVNNTLENGVEVIDNEGDENFLSHDQYEVIKESSEWSGEGLPPVGAICEVYHKDNPKDIRKGALKYISDQVFVFDQGDREFGGLTKNWEFQPINLQKKIEIEELGKEIDYFVETLPDNKDVSLQEYLHSIGYRKSK